MTVKLFVGNLSPWTTEQQLRRLFSTVGMRISVEICRNHETGRSRRFGFVEFQTEEEAERALVVFDGRTLGNRVLRMERARDSEGENGQVEGTLWEGHPRRAGEVASLEAFDHRRGGDYTADHGAAKRRHGKHGSDRIRGRGTRRTTE